MNMCLVQALLMYHEGGEVCRCVNLFIACRQQWINLTSYPKTRIEMCFGFAVYL